MNSPVWTTGKYGNGLQFNGTNYVSTTLSRPESGTMSLWVYPTTFNSWVSPIGWKVTGRFILIDEGGGPTPGNWRASFKPAATETAISGPAIVQNSWTHLVYTWSLSGTTYTLRFYVNGTQVGTTSWTGVPDTDMGGLYFGTAGQIVSNNYTGRVDDVRIYNRAINADEVIALYNYVHSPVAHWKFDDASGTTAIDSSVNGNNGTLTNGPTWVGGRYGNAINFDGMDDYVGSVNLLPNNFGATYTGGISAMAWVRPTANGTYRSVFDTTGRQLTLLWKTGTGTSNWYGIGTSQGSWPSTNTLSLNTWHHVAITSSGSAGSVTMYRNGVVEYTGANPGVVFTSELRVGQNPSGGGVNFIGQIDDVRIYNYQLNQAQIQRVMNNEI